MLPGFLAYVLACADPAPAPPSAAGEGLVVLTYNVNFERVNGETIDAMRAAEADLIFLQETHPAWLARIEPALAATHPHRVVQDHPPDGGSAVFSRWPLRAHATPASPVGAFPAQCVLADTPLGPLAILHVHLHPPLDANGLVSGYLSTGALRGQELRAHLGCFGRPPDLALGDFNEEAGEAVDAALSAGLVDAASALGVATRTWRWDTGVTELEGRPDHVFVGRAWRPTSAEAPERGGSDHLPLRVRLARSVR
jgi:endonuclease/exonuclease/phosphatase family metal-dependent hydrolase